MAKKSSIEKNNRRRRMAKKYSGRRARLKAIARDKIRPVEERFAATLKLAEPGRAASFKEIAISTGKKHGAFFQPLPEWIAPLRAWIEETNH